MVLQERFDFVFEKLLEHRQANLTTDIDNTFLQLLLTTTHDITIGKYLSIPVCIDIVVGMHFCTEKKLSRFLHVFIRINRTI